MNGKFVSRAVAGALLFTMLLGACATTAVRSVWKDEAFRGGLHNVLVIAIDRNPKLENLLEDVFVDKLRAAGTEAVASHIVMPYERPLEKRAIMQKVREDKIDGVLVLRLSDVKDAGPYETYPSFVETESLYGYYVKCCSVVSVGYDVMIDTKIFDARHDTLVWASMSESVYRGSVEVLLESAVPTIIADMKKGNVLR